MAFYSTWDWNRNAWRIYRTPETVSVGDDPKPPRPAASSVLGVDPDTAVRPLPSNARFIGYDHVARGEVRRPAGVGGLGEIGDSGFWRDAGLVAIGAAAIVVGQHLIEGGFGRKRR